MRLGFYTLALCVSRIYEYVQLVLHLANIHVVLMVVDVVVVLVFVVHMATAEPMMYLLYSDIVDDSCMSFTLE